jgi:hypothetical protein
MIKKRVVVINQNQVLQVVDAHLKALKLLFFLTQMQCIWFMLQLLVKVLRGRPEQLRQATKAKITP